MDHQSTDIKNLPNRNGLIFILFIAVIAGISSSEWYLMNISSKALPDIFLNALLGFGLLTWISKDLEKFSTKPSQWLSGFAIILPLPTSFYYAFSRYGFKKGGILSIKILGFILICIPFLLIPMLLLNHFS